MIIKKDGKKYVKIGNMAVPFEKYDNAGKPIIKPIIERVNHPDGRKDVKITIPSLKIKR